MKRSAWFGQANVGHICRDSGVLQSYLIYWQKLSTDPCIQELKRFNSEQASRHCRSFWAREQNKKIEEKRTKMRNKRRKRLEAKREKQRAQVALRQRLETEFASLPRVGCVWVG